MGEQEVTENSQNGGYLGKKFYDFLKFVALILLPVFGTLYFTLDQIRGFPNSEEVVGAVVVADTFIGLLVALSATLYKRSDAKYDGVINIEDDDGHQTASMELLHLEDPTDIVMMKEVLFRVNPSKTS